ncbi:hypothetical protein JEQ12_003402 [Ovis aries]|uniref:G-protein coupled receptors family 1 profile domain-containing protein n=1 Tax=Ovis aries TaxID=9940 RepID=A0A836CYH6_SHEEP|nr:hypothetical protein JEQ12_003402 [Ovis aries]
MTFFSTKVYDHYIAISRPLYHVTIMSIPLCVGLVVTAWMVGFVHSISQLALMLPLPFCGPSVLDNFYWDVLQVLRLACTDTSVLEFLMICNSGMLDVIWFLLLLVSYSAILVMLRSHSGQAKRKAASTCTTHIIVVSMVFIPSIYLYARPFISFSMDKTVQAVSNQIMHFCCERLTSDHGLSLKFMQCGQFIGCDLDFPAESPARVAFTEGIDCESTCAQLPSCFPIKLRNQTKVLGLLTLSTRFQDNSQALLPIDNLHNDPASSLTT